MLLTFFKLYICFSILYFLVYMQKYYNSIYNTHKYPWIFLLIFTI